MLLHLCLFLGEIGRESQMEVYWIDLRLLWSSVNHRWRSTESTWDYYGLVWITDGGLLNRFEITMVECESRTEVYWIDLRFIRPLMELFVLLLNQWSIRISSNYSSLCELLFRPFLRKAMNWYVSRSKMVWDELRRERAISWSILMQSLFSVTHKNRRHNKSFNSRESNKYFCCEVLPLFSEGFLMGTTFSYLRCRRVVVL
jgi:hypothetical protein